jgi:hypothetical protein
MMSWRLNISQATWGPHVCVREASFGLWALKYTRLVVNQGENKQGTQEPEHNNIDKRRGK